MNQLNKVWTAAAVAVAQGHPTEQGTKWRSCLQSLHHGKRQMFSGSGDGSDLRPLAASARVGSDLSSAVDDVARQTDESMRRVMYMNCWGQG
ncbi:hypothetical protein LINGRAHAP2_LOCUS28773 [Linum grandiflorum]